MATNISKVNPLFAPALLFLLLLLWTVMFVYCTLEPSPSTNPPELAEEIDESENQNKYLPLKLMKIGYNGGFKLTLGYQPKATLSNKNLFYLCPAESKHHNDVSTHFSEFKYCLFVKKKGNKVSDPKSVFCEKQVEPYFWNEEETEQNGCGKDRQGVFYNYAYEVCWETWWKYTNPRTWKENPNIRKFKNSYVEIYSICSSKRSKHQAIYARYTLIVPPFNYDDELTSEQYEAIALNTRTKGACNLEFDEIASLYEPENQKPILEKHFGNDFTDLLIAQLLVPSIHLTQEFAKDSTRNYANVRPQWRSLSQTWQSVNEFIRKLVQNNPFSIFVYAGTSGQLSVNDVQLNLEKGDAKITVPSIWWKLLINRDNGDSIVLAMNNSFPHPNIRHNELLCKDSICGTAGWDKVTDGHLIYCCKFTQNMKTSLELDQENIAIGEVFKLVLSS